MTTYKLSPTTLDLYVDCQTCFWDHIHGNKRPTGKFSSLPSGMDKTFKRRFDAYRKRGEVPSELSSLENISLFSDEKLLREWRDQWKGIQWINENGHVLNGALDEVLQSAAGELIVLDYKTRGFPLKETPTYYTLQLECYTLLLEKKGFAVTDHAYLLVYYPDTFTEQGEVKFHHRLLTMPVSVENAARTFTGALEVLSKEKPKLNQNCEFCIYKGK